jgi:hypothetical protein
MIIKIMSDDRRGKARYSHPPPNYQKMLNTVLALCIFQYRNKFCGCPTSGKNLGGAHEEEDYLLRSDAV